MFCKIVNINYIITKFATFASYTCTIMCTKFGKKQTPFAQVTIKSWMDPSSRTRNRLPSVLNLRCLCCNLNTVYGGAYFLLHICSLDLNVELVENGVFISAHKEAFLAKDGRDVMFDIYFLVFLERLQTMILWTYLKATLKIHIVL